MKTIQTLFFVMLLLLYSSCNKAQTKSESTASIKMFTEKVKNSNRLTDKSLSSFFPKTFLGQKFSGEFYSKTSKPDAYKKGAEHSFTQLYGEVGDISIAITDYSDNQRHINLMKQYGKKEKTVKHSSGGSKSYKDSSGLYIYESFNGFNGNINNSSLVVSNPRFDITIDSRKQRIEAYKPEVLLKELRKTNLFKLFDLSIPDNPITETENIANNNTKKVLNCDELLPMSVVKTICNKTVSIKTTSFEKDYNCNRSYLDKNSSGALIFLVTQYARARTSKAALKIDKGKEIPNLGDAAIYFKIGDDEYLKVNYKNYLLELRSTKGFGKEGVCYTEKELVKLMKGIISRLE